MKLNLGSFAYPRSGYLNVDIANWPGVDDVVDLEKMPWPYLTQSAEEIRAIDIIEHLGKRTKWEILNELARVCKIGGRVIVRVPCATHYSALNSLQHAHSFYFDSFLPSYAQPYFYVNKMWCHVGGFRIPFVTPLHKILRILAWFRFVQMIEWELERHNHSRWKMTPSTPNKIERK